MPKARRAEVGRTCIHKKGVTVRFGFDAVRTSQLQTDCQKQSNNTCSSSKLGNCNTCVAKPKTSWPFMLALAKKYLKEDISIEYVESLYSIKPILQESEIDDSRPTVIKEFSRNPKLVAVLSGKINTVYDLDIILSNKE